jgi:ferredoxin-NADP reductase
MHTTRLLGKRDVADGTMEFSFERPEGFAYEAGQTIDLKILEPKEMDAEGNFRTFTLLSAPHEEELRIASRMRDTAFKRNLKNMEPGTELSFEGPFGSFTLHENTKRPAVFLGGGIGVTPFRSIISDATKRSLSHQLFLFNSNRRPEDAVCLDELQQFQDQNPNVTFVPVVTQPEKSKLPWEGETGHVNTEMLARYVPQNTMPVYYLAGPQGMVLALRDALIKGGVSKDDIRYEEFAGY